MTTHEIINSLETHAGVELEIRWKSVGYNTNELYSPLVAKALGWKHPDPQPVDPAWMVEVARVVTPQWARDYSLNALAQAMEDDEVLADHYRQLAFRALRLALSRNHVVLAPVMPSEEEMLRDAREDAAQIEEAGGYDGRAHEVRTGRRDLGDEVQCALQARRNVYASLGAVAGQAVSSGPVVPEVDLRRVAKEAWNAGYMAAGAALGMIHNGLAIAPKYQTVEREKDVSAILENLKSGEA